MMILVAIEKWSMTKFLVATVLMASVSTAGFAQSWPDEEGPDEEWPDEEWPDEEWPDEEWPVSTPEAEQVDGDAIDALVADMRLGKYGLLDHFLLIRHGKVIADHHFEHDYQTLSKKHEPKAHQYDYDHPDWHPYYRGTRLHTLQSVTKSITSIAIGMAIDEGKLPSVDRPVMALFEGYRQDMSDPHRRAVTLEDLLTMRSGIRWNEMTSYLDESNSCIQLEASDHWIQFVLDQLMRESPGSVFDYNSGVSVLLGKLVRIGTGQRIDAYLNENLFEPIGIDEFHWKISPDGEADTEGGLYLTAHDLARVAYLFLREGRWKDKQVVSKEWVTQSTSPVVPDIRPNNDRTDQGYGYQWWVPKHEDGETQIFSGSGYGGQFPIVIPKFDLVVVFYAWNIHERPELSTQVALRERILPAMRGGEGSSG